MFELSENYQDLEDLNEANKAFEECRKSGEKPIPIEEFFKRSNLNINSLN